MLWWLCVATQTVARQHWRRDCRGVHTSVLSVLLHSTTPPSDPKAFSPEDMLFATLDSKVRSLTLPSGSSCFVVDTVGFISDLPTDLVAAFRATLSELTHCDVLLHVRDASNPTAETQGDAVLDVLRSIGVPHGTLQHRIDVWNKADLLSDEQLEGLDSMVSDQVSSCRVSAETGRCVCNC